jgi:Flp pilus assembly protein TadG
MTAAIQAGRISFWRRDDGATAVETGLSMLAVLLFMCGLVEFCWAFWNWNSLQLAVAQGARFAMVSASGSTTATCASLQAGAQTTASSSLIGFSGATITSSCSGSGSNATMTVTGTYTFTPVITPLIPAMTISTSATVPLM